MIAVTEYGRSIELEFNYNPRIVEDVKNIQGRYFNQNKKVWVVPAEQKEAVQLLIKRYGSINNLVVKQPEQVHQIPELPELGIEIPLKRTLFPFQAKGVAQGLVFKRFINGDQPGLGKAQPLDTKIPTPNGFINMGNLRVGEEAFSNNGTATKIQAIYPQGTRPIYKVTFNDGSSTECDLEHLWQVRDINRRRRNTGWIVKSTKELLEIGLTWNPCDLRKESGRKPLLKWEIPLTKPVIYSTKKYVIHPYIMGMLLGDGCLHTNGRGSISISIPDTEIESVDRIKKLLPDNLKLVANRHPACPQYYFNQKNKTTKPNPFKSEINRLQLNVLGKNKFIPDIYLLGNIEQRKQLLQGLMDSDGSAKANRITFHTCSESLANSVKLLVLSLGGQVIARKYNRSIKENKSDEYQLNIHIDFCPFQLERKKQQWKKITFRRFIKSIEFVGNKECQCIKVSAKSELYLTNDYIVTHNTTQAIATAVGAGCKCILVICPSSLKINWQREWETVAGIKSMILNDSVKTTWQKYYSAGICNVFITNYESLKKFFVHKINTPQGKRLSLKYIEFKKEIELFDCVIIDELHRCKDGSTQQSKFVMGLTRGKEYIFGLTGTPVVNKPKDLISQLYIINQLQNVVPSYKYFMDRYCGGGGNGAFNLKELNYKLATTCFFQRQKKDVLKELPDKMRNIVLCDITTRKEYNDAINDLANYMKEYRSATDAQVERSMRGEIMVRIGICKNISARGKLNEVFEYVDEVTEAGEKVVVFIHQKEIALKLLERYPQAVSVRGDDNQDQRQNAIDKFQNDSRTNIIICSIKAAGVGITLTASSRVAFVELPWHPADCDQCEDRVHRIGQKDSVQATYFLGNETIDQHIYDIIEKKRLVANEVTGTTDSVQREIIDKIKNLFN